MAQKMQSEQPVEPKDKPSFQSKSFTELFPSSELTYYAVAAVVYIALGLVFTDRVLNFIVGPLFFIGWMWVVPLAWERWRRS